MKALDAAVIMMEGGTEHDLTILDGMSIMCSEMSYPVTYPVTYTVVQHTWLVQGNSKRCFYDRTLLYLMVL